MRKTGKEWAELMKIPILEPKGWASVNEYENTLVTKEEFCNRAANCSFQTERASSRRDAAVMLQKYKERHAEPKKKTV